MSAARTTLSSLYCQAVDNAEYAANKGTFGVGGILMADDGRLLKAIENAVVQDGAVKDPTGHVERQLIGWYYAEKLNGTALPAEKDCTIVSSLDPCLMCGGSALASGIKVISANFDDFVGVNWQDDFQFASLPEALRDRAKDIFAYAAIDGVRPFTGRNDHIFAQAAVGAALVERSKRVFLDSLSSVRNSVGEVSQNEPSDISTRPLSGAAIKILLSTAEQAQKNGNVFQAGMLVSPLGEVLYAAGDASSESPINTALMRVMRGYARKRWDVRQDAAALADLPHPKFCQYVQLLGPDGSAASIADLGAYGSTIESPLPAWNTNAFGYLVPKMAEDKLAQIVANLPPYYSKVIGINPVKVTTPAFAQYTTQDLPRRPK